MWPHRVGFIFVASRLRHGGPASDVPKNPMPRICPSTAILPADNLIGCPRGKSGVCGARQMTDGRRVPHARADLAQTASLSAIGLAAITRPRCHSRGSFYAAQIGPGRPALPRVHLIVVNFEQT